MSAEAARPSSPKRQRVSGPDTMAADESKSASGSWVEYGADCEFPIQNIPFGVFKPKEDSTPRIGTAIGDKVRRCAVPRLLPAHVARTRAPNGRTARDRTLTHPCCDWN